MPCRAARPGMSAYEMMLSESQERMLMVLDAREGSRGRGDLPQMGARFRGHRPDDRRSALRRQTSWGEVKADLPIKELGDEAPLYDRPHVPTPKQRRDQAARIFPRRIPMPMRCCASSARRTLLEALGLRAIRPSDPRQYGAGAGRRCGGDPHRRRAEGSGADHRRERESIATPIPSRAASRRWPKPGAISAPSAPCRWR